MQQDPDHGDRTEFAPGVGADPGADRLTYRGAVADDLPLLVAMLADDGLGRHRETPVDPLPGSYGRALAAIDESPGTELIVVEADGRTVGTMQLNFLPSLSRGGSSRMQIEAVRVAGDLRGGGIGRRMMEWAIERARERGCRLVELTTDKRRIDAHRFYLRLGFRASHEGMKLFLDPSVKGSPPAEET